MHVGVPPAKSTKDPIGINRTLDAYTNLIQALYFAMFFVRDIKGESYAVNCGVLFLYGEYRAAQNEKIVSCGLTCGKIMHGQKA